MESCTNASFGLDDVGKVASVQHGVLINRTIHRNALGFKETECIDAGIRPTVANTFRSIKTHNDADQLTAETIQEGTNEYTRSYWYNDNGGLENISYPATTYTYDYNNRLTGVSGSSEIDYLHDASGGRIGRINGSVTNYFVIDQVDTLKRPLAETDSSGNITRYYVWAGMRLLCHIDSDGTTRYYHSDELGSTLALTDEAGNVTDEYAYMPYGYATHTSHAGSSDTPFQWLGGYGVYYDASTDLHLTLHRAYSSQMKRFISPDPLGIDGGVNVYMWANMNPFYFIDPTGLINWKLVGKGVVGMTANGAMAVGGAALAKTGVGAAVAVYGAYQFGASFGNVINGFKDSPEGPTGPVQTVAQIGMIVGDVNPNSREWAKVDTVASTADMVIPLVLSAKIDTRLITTPAGKPGTLLGTVEKVYISPENANAILKAGVWANNALFAVDRGKFLYDEFTATEGPLK